MPIFHIGRQKLAHPGRSGLANGATVPLRWGACLIALVLRNGPSGQRVEKGLGLTLVDDTVHIADEIEAYRRVLDVPVLVTGELVEALLEEGSEELAAVFRDEGFRKLPGRKKPVHLFSLKQEGERQQAILPAPGVRAIGESPPQIAGPAKDDALGLLLRMSAPPDQK
jgi:class 3 adenylate cyclase